MEKWVFSINFYDLVFLFTISVGITFCCLLFFTKRINRQANRFLGLALLVIVLWIVWVTAIDVQLNLYFPHWSWLPLQYSLALGPLIWFYVRKLTIPEAKFSTKNLFYFSPLIFEQSIQLVQVLEARTKHISTFETLTFRHFNPLLQLLALISMITYLASSIRLLKKYDQKISESYSDIFRYQYHWLKRLLFGLFILWLLWIPFVAADYFLYNYNLSISNYYVLYLLIAGIAIWLSAEAFLRPEVLLLEPPLSAVTMLKVPSPEILENAKWLKRQLEANLFYRNSELSLRSLAEELEIHPHELSRIINLGTGKNFNDLINDYRVNDVIFKMKDPAFDHITLLGIAFDSGFNSKTTFNRTFKNMTGKTPADYKSALKRATIL